MIDSHGIELIHSIRKGCSLRQIGKKGKSNWRWIVGMKLCWLLSKLGSHRSPQVAADGLLPHPPCGGLPPSAPLRAGSRPQSGGVSEFNDKGEIVAWGWNTANVHDQVFLPLVQQLADESIVLADGGFNSAEGIPSSLKLCRGGCGMNAC